MTTGRVGAGDAEVSAVLGFLVSPRGASTADADWYAHLSSRQVLLTEVAARIADERARAVAAMHATGRSYADIAAEIGGSRARAQQLAERGRAARQRHGW